jgi:putative SOS response-associated peptidase YedK
VITTTANDAMAPIHDRMPVILPRGAWDRWLGDDADLDELLALLVPADESVLAMYAVSADVGNVKNNGSYLIDEIDEAEVAAAEAARNELPGQGSLL